MSNQTLQPPTSKRRVRSSNNAKTGSARRPNKRYEGRRDGKPLIFGWGRHLTKLQKQRIQHRAAYAFSGVVIVAIIGVFIFGVIQQNVLIPNQAIVTINGVNVPQDTYRRLFAYNAQVEWNTLQHMIKQQNDIKPKVQAGDQDAVAQNALLTTQIQTEEANYQQAALSQKTIDQLVENQLIQQGATRFAKQVPSTKFEPTNADVAKDFAAFKAAFPANEKYSDFLQKNNLTDDDVRNAIKISSRRTFMQTYLASLLVSPTRQAHVRHIETNTLADAKKVYDALVKDPSAANWNKLAKESSLDPNTKNTGGDMGWLVHGTGDSALDNWAYTPGRKPNELSQPFKDSNGTFQVAEVVEFDNSRAVDATQLKDAQNNALDHWLSGQRADTSNHISTPVQDMLTATRNLPVLPDLNAVLPNEGTPQPSGLPTGP
ncbi:MAG: peptidylprolyl isomerase [Ktedonobacterales bacterium]